jgi:hypothetical protein
MKSGQQEAVIANPCPPGDATTIQPIPLLQGSCEKIDLVLFGVIPVKAGIQVFHGLTS